MRKLASEYGWPPEVIGRLTPYQAYILCGAYCPEDGQVSLTPGEAAKMGVGSARQVARTLGL